MWVDIDHDLETCVSCTDHHRKRWLVKYWAEIFSPKNFRNKNYFKHISLCHKFHLNLFLRKWNFQPQKTHQKYILNLSSKDDIFSLRESKRNWINSNFSFCITEKDLPKKSLKSPEVINLLLRGKSFMGRRTYLFLKKINFIIEQQFKFKIFT